MDDHDGGLAFDLPRLLDRRGALRVLAGVGLTAAFGAACSREGDPQSAPSTTGRAGGPGSTPSTAAAAGQCDDYPETTAGPFPGDGSNGPNVLDDAGVVRQDIRSSVGSASGRAEGLALTLRLKIVRAAGSCAPLAGAAVYLWHCDRDGRYSLYERSVAGENYLRGVQPAGDDGALTFTTIFPGAYPGRWPHMHFSVYPDLGEAARGRGELATAQLALPADACRMAYDTAGYSRSAQALSSLSLERDGVFRGDAARQLATVAGDPDSGMTATLTVAV